MSTPTGTIYCLTSPSGKKYVGLTKRKLQARILQHRRCTSCAYIRNAIDKYGIESFRVDVLESPSVSKLPEREKFWIMMLNTKHPNGYNLTDGGDGHSNPTEETRRKISEANRRRPPLTEEQRAKRSIAQRNLYLAKPIPTHCKYGHLLSTDNVYIEIARSGYPVRHCKKCRADSYKKIYQKRIDHMHAMRVAENNSRTHCKNGHRLTGSNVFMYEISRGSFVRGCKKCKRIAGIMGADKKWGRL